MSVPPEMLAALQGGGEQMAPADPMGGMGGMGGGLPPDIMAALGGGEEPLPGVTDGAPGGGQDALTQAIDLLQEAIDAEADQEDIQVMLQCQTKLQQVLAKNQAEADSMMGGKMSPRAMRKAI